MMLDFHVYPILERIVRLENSPWNTGFEKLDAKTKCPSMFEYVNKFSAHPKMAPHCFKSKHYNNLMNEYDEI